MREVGGVGPTLVMLARAVAFLAPASEFECFAFSADFFFFLFVVVFFFFFFFFFVFFWLFLWLGFVTFDFT